MKHLALRPAAFVAALFLTTASPRWGAAAEPSASKNAPATAEPGAAVRTGSRVRVTAASSAFTGSLVGTLISASAEKLIILDPKNGAVSELPVDSVRRLEVSEPRHRGRTGALIGVALGFGSVALAGSGYSEVGCGRSGGPYLGCEEAKPGEVMAVGAFAAALYGGLGYWIGKRSRVDVWSDAPVGDLKVSVQPLKKGGRLAFSFSF